MLKTVSLLTFIFCSTSSGFAQQSSIAELSDRGTGIECTVQPFYRHRPDGNATIYSWVMNNHWHTNFPLSQEGKFLFRYRIFPHNNTYNADKASRFGMEQSQPLIVVPVK
jgi:hypothetical protein